MHFPKNPSEKATSLPTSITRALMAAIALSVASSCAPIQNAHPIDRTVQKSEVSEWDIDNPVFIALVSISAGVQSELEYEPKSRSIESILNTVNEQLKEMGINKKASVRLVGIQETGRGYTYAVMECDGQEAYISAKNATTALEITGGIQDAYITHIEKQIRLNLGDKPATKEILERILGDEENGFRQCRIFGHVTPDSGSSWTISFEAEM